MRSIALLFILTFALGGCLDSAPEVSTGSGGGEQPLARATFVAPAWGSEDAPIRPGASLGGYCTFNFLFVDSVTGDVYIGTAAHCTSELDERLELPGVGEIATVVFDSDLAEAFPEADPAVDFTLARLDDERIGEAHPRMLGWDGPTGNVTLDDLAMGDEVQLHGYGVLLGQNDLTRDRSGYLVDWDDRLYRVDMPAVNGDSGSPLLHGPTGKAFGIVSHYGLGATPPSTDEGPLMHFVLEQIHANGFPDVHLATV